MSLLLVFLFESSRSPEPWGTTYLARTDFVGSVDLRSCLFLGGGLALSNSTARLTIQDCRFEGCRYYSDGGGVMANCLFFSMAQTTAWNCSAQRFGFCSVLLSASSPGAADIRESSVSACSADSGHGILGVEGSSDHEDSANIEEVNSSKNFGASALGLRASVHHFLGFHFSAFSENTGASCFFIDWIDTNNISFLCLLNNTCKSDSLYPGLMYVYATLELVNCVFALNSFDYLLGIYSDQYGRVDFVGCVFDFDEFPAKNYIYFETHSCAVESRPTLIAACMYDYVQMTTAPFTGMSPPRAWPSHVVRWGIFVFLLSV